ncbi:hypothetical protein ACFL0W_04320 [Nanoarchaeota archaeon]
MHIGEVIEGYMKHRTLGYSTKRRIADAQLIGIDGINRETDSDEPEFDYSLIAELSDLLTDRERAKSEDAAEFAKQITSYLDWDSFSQEMTAAAAYIVAAEETGLKSVKKLIYYEPGQELSEYGAPFLQYVIPALAGYANNQESEPADSRLDKTMAETVKMSVNLAKLTANGVDKAQAVNYMMSIAMDSSNPAKIAETPVYQALAAYGASFEGKSSIDSVYN